MAYVILLTVTKCLEISQYFSLCGNPAICIKWMDLEDIMLISEISQKLLFPPPPPHPCLSRSILRCDILYPAGKGEAVRFMQVLKGLICALKRMLVWFQALIL